MDKEIKKDLLEEYIREKEPGKKRVCLVYWNRTAGC